MLCMAQLKAFCPNSALSIGKATNCMLAAGKDMSYVLIPRLDLAVQRDQTAAAFIALPFHRAALIRKQRSNMKNVESKSDTSATSATILLTETEFAPNPNGSIEFKRQAEASVDAGLKG